MSKQPEKQTSPPQEDEVFQTPVPTDKFKKTIPVDSKQLEIKVNAFRYEEKYSQSNSSCINRLNDR